MILTDTIGLALRNLRQSKLRTTLTSLGVSIGIASLAGMVSLGVGLENQVVGGVLTAGVFDSITVLPGRGAMGRGFMGGRGNTRRGRATGPAATAAPADPTSPTVTRDPAKVLDDAAITEIGAIEGVREAYPNVRPQVEARLNSYSEVTGAVGVPPSAKDEGVFKTMAAGTFFPNDTENTCIISLEMAKRINPQEPKSVVGQEMTITYAAASQASAPVAPQPVMPQTLEGTSTPMQFQRLAVNYRIVGVVERESGGAAAVLSGGFSGLMIPLAKAREIDAHVVTGPEALLRAASDRKSYMTVTVKVKRSQDTQDVEDKIKEMGYSAISVNDALSGAKRAFIIVDIILSLIGSIALAVSSLGIVNTMVMSILERTREIGIMKAVGGSDSDVRRIFLVEASTIGLIGGSVGVAIGWFVGRVINFFANWYIRSQGGNDVNLFSLPFWLIGGSIGFALLVSLIAGSFPARRAARLDPIQALRHD